MSDPYIDVAVRHLRTAASILDTPHMMQVIADIDVTAEHLHQVSTGYKRIAALTTLRADAKSFVAALKHLSDQIREDARLLEAGYPPKES